MAVSHVYSNAVADGTATSVVRPSDWNSAHNQFLTLAGNTAGASTISGTNIVLSGGANVTLSVDGQSLVFSGAAANTGFISAGAATASLGTVVFANSNGLSFGVNGQTVTASHNAITSQSVQTQGSVQVQGSTGAISFANSNGITIGGNASTITFSHNGLTTQTVQTQSNVQGISAGTQAGRTGDIVFADSNGISFGMSGSTRVTASYTVPSVAGLLSAINLSAGTTSQNLSAFVFSNSNSISFGLNGSTVTASVGEKSYSQWEPHLGWEFVAGNQGQGTLHVQPMVLPYAVQYDRILMPISNTNATNSSGSHTLSFWVGIYTKNDSTLSLASSTLGTVALTHSGTAGSYSLYSGMRHFTIGSTNTITKGEYWLGILSRTTSGGANGSYTQLCALNLNVPFNGYFGESNNTTNQLQLGLGTYSATTAGMPAAIAFSEINGSGSLVIRPPVYQIRSGTA